VTKRQFFASGSQAPPARKAPHRLPPALAARAVTGRMAKHVPWNTHCPGSIALALFTHRP
jgi:hypothetical protein